VHKAKLSLVGCVCDDISVVLFLYQTYSLASLPPRYMTQVTEVTLYPEIFDNLTNNINSLRFRVINGEGRK
jgi:hypothetical protein